MKSAEKELYRACNKALRTKQARVWDRWLGKMFGFPSCCTEFYIKHVGTAPYWWEKHFKKFPGIMDKIGHTGFIPCPNHAKQIWQGKITAKDLIKNRKYPIPYPDSV